MRFKSLLATVLGISFFISYAHSQDRPVAVPGEFIVELVEPIHIQHIKNQNYVSQVRTLLDNHFAKVQSKPGSDDISVMNDLLDSPFVKKVEPNYYYYLNESEPAFVTPNDSGYSDLWGMRNSSSDAGLRDIDAERAWKINTGSREVLIAVIDSGVDYTHEDLVNNMWVNEAEAQGTPNVDDDGNGLIDDIHGYNFFADHGDPLDGNGHGTHCAGTIGAEGNNGIGVAGVVWNARIMAIKAFGDDGRATLESTLNALIYANKMKANVVSNSWGGLIHSEIMKDIIGRMNTDNQVFVAASGNNGYNTDLRNNFPSGYNLPNVISVGSISQNGMVSSFSNYGPGTIDVYAPGDEIYSTTPRNGYQKMSGTSMAAPHVSGVAALILSHEPHLTAKEVRDRIIRTARPIKDTGRDSYLPSLVSAYHALLNNESYLAGPITWEQAEVNISTPHPYPANSNFEWRIIVPGAKSLSLYFAEMNTERRFDTLRVYDSQDNLVGEFSGFDAWGNSFSPVIPGDSARLVFTSDEDVELHGFEIPFISYEKASPASQEPLKAQVQILN